MSTNLTRLANDHKPDPLRACVHDLRNLFAVVASAKFLLDRPVGPERKGLILDALSRVAVEGKILTDALLAGRAEEPGRGTEAAGELQILAPIIKALERPGQKIDVTIDEQPAWVLMPRSEFSAVVLELVTNAVAAGARTIRIRGARRGRRFWLLAGDDGAGFAQTTKAPATEEAAGLHGTGLGRLASAAGSAHGALRIRSGCGRGSVVAMVLPIIKTLPASLQPPLAVSIG
jgi:signal transduction histidine kinase